MMNLEKKKTKKRLKNLKELKIKTYIKREGIEKTKQKIKKGANFFLLYDKKYKN